MKKLLNVLSSKWFIVVLAVILAALFAIIALRQTRAFDDKKDYPTYDWQNCDSFINGLPDYGIKNRNNILLQG